MPYVPRPATTAQCAYCGGNFEKKHASRKYCSNSCNVQASYARTGYRSEGRVTRAELEQTLAKMTDLVKLLTSQATPAAKAAATKSEAVEGLALAAERVIELAKAKAQKRKPAAKAAVKPAPAAKAAATKSKKKITKPLPPAPAGSDFDMN